MIQSSNRERQLQEALLRELETKRKIKSIVVPTDDGRVRVLLRQLGDPVTLFGEREVSAPASFLPVVCLSHCNSLASSCAV